MHVICVFWEGVDEGVGQGNRGENKGPFSSSGGFAPAVQLEWFGLWGAFPDVPRLSPLL